MAAQAQLGPAREGTVREILRNLATVQGTRAVREREELLSIFGRPEPDAPPAEKREAEQVLDALVDARLLTCYQVPPPGAAPAAIRPSTCAASMTMRASFD